LLAADVEHVDVLFLAVTDVDILQNITTNTDIYSISTVDMMDTIYYM